MLERFGIGGGTAGAERAGMIGGPAVEAVVAGCPGGMAFGLGGMYGASLSPSAAVLAAAGATATLSLRGTTGAAASGRGAGTGAGGPGEFPAGETLAAASGLRAGTGAEVPGGLPAGTLVGFPDGSTPTGLLAGSGGGGPRLANPGGSAGGRVDGGGLDVFSASSVSTESCPKSFPDCFVAEVLAAVTLMAPEPFTTAD